MRLYHVQLGWQVDLFFMTQDEEDKSQVYSGYHTFPGIYHYKVYYNKTIFQDICSAEALGVKIMVPCDYESLLVTEYGPQWVTPDEHHFLIRQPRQHRTFWDESEATAAYQCLGRNQFDIRDTFHFSDYRYTHRRELQPQRENKALQNAMDEYKSTCTKLRWDRVS